MNINPRALEAHPFVPDLPTIFNSKELENVE